MVGTCPSAQQFQPLPGPSHPLPKVSWKAREGRRNEVRRTHQSRLADVPQCPLAFVQTCSRVSKQTWDWLRAAVSESRQPPFGSVTTGIDQSESARGATGENRKNAKTTLGDWGALALGNITQRQTETHTHTHTHTHRTGEKRGRGLSWGWGWGERVKGEGGCLPGPEKETVRR